MAKSLDEELDKLFYSDKTRTFVVDELNRVKRNWKEVKDEHLPDGKNLGIIVDEASELEKVLESLAPKIKKTLGLADDTSLPEPKIDELFSYKYNNDKAGDLIWSVFGLYVSFAASCLLRQKLGLLDGPPDTPLDNAIILSIVPSAALMGNSLNYWMHKLSSRNSKTVGKYIHKDKQILILGNRRIKYIYTDVVHEYIHYLQYHYMKEELTNSDILLEGHSTGGGEYIIKTLFPSDKIFENLLDILRECRLEDAIKLHKMVPNYIKSKNQESNKYDKGYVLFKMAEQRHGDKVYSELLRGNVDLLF
ncbi:MAG: hypothetical protein KAK00_00820 [Nanoarchaeota archaeon]|nr:hypothetical protein [Nanoarchaeota archaeon]